MKINKFLVLLMIFCFSLHSSNDTFYKMLNLESSNYSVNINPAVFSLTQNFILSIGYSNLWSGLTDGSSISNSFLVANYPLKFLSCAFSYNSFGVVDIYKTDTYSLSISKNFNSRISIGASLKSTSKNYLNVESYNNEYFQIYGSKISAISLDLGFSYFDKKIILGGYVYDVNQPEFSLLHSEEILPISFGFNFGFLPMSDLILDVNGYFKQNNSLFLLCVEKEFENTSLRSGCKFNIKNMLSPLLGISYRFVTSFADIKINYEFHYPLGVVRSVGNHNVNLAFAFSTIRLTQQEEKLTKETDKVYAAKLLLRISKTFINKDDKEIIFNVETDTNVKSWQLSVLNESKKKTIKKFFSNQNVDQIVWSLRNDEGKLIPKGKYFVEIVGFGDNNEELTREVSTFIVREELEETTREEKMLYCPNCGAEVIEGERFCPVCKEQLKK